MLYAILKLIYRVGLQVFFRNFEVRNRHLIPNQGPLLVVSNHPNTFMDPIVIASLLRQPVYFIAKGTVFGSGFQNWVLRQMHLIPIHRREDNPDQPVSNEEAFAASFQALQNGQTMLIFPEGNSFSQRRLRKIKTGTARIALGAEAESHYTLGVKILPIGLNYSAPTRFRSDVFVNIGEPITVADYAQACTQDTKAATLALTNEIRNCLESRIIHTPTDEEDTLARQVETLYKKRLAATVPPKAPPHIYDFILTKAIIRGINHFSQVAPERVIAIKKEINHYTLQLKRLRLHDALLGKGPTAILKKSAIGLFLLLLGLPIFLYGLLHNYLPYIIPSRVARALTKAEEWYAPIMLTVGIFTFPLFYWLEVWLLSQWVDMEGLNLVLHLLTLPLSGFFTLGYWDTLLHTQAHWLLLRMFFQRRRLIEQLKQERKHIIAQLEQARIEYLALQNAK